MNAIAEALVRKGYTDRHVREHEGRNWGYKRWYCFQGADKSIIEIVTANFYTRITHVAKDEYKLLEYKSEDYPEHPKTEFFLNPFREPTILNLQQILVAIAARELGARSMCRMAA